MGVGIRDYLEIRVASPTSFSPDGRKLLVASNLPGTTQLFTVNVGGGQLHQVTDEPEPVSGWYLPTDDRILVAKDEGGNERHQLYLCGDGHTPLEPVVHEPEWIHAPGGISRDGQLVAYRTNRRNGVDFDVHVHDLHRGDDRCVFAPGGWAHPAGFSPDGRWLAVLRMTERNMDNDLYLVDLEGEEVVHVSPHDDESSFGAPAWLPDGSAFYFPTDAGRDRIAVARYDVATRSWTYVVEREDADLDVEIDDAGTALLLVASSDGFTTAELRDPRTMEHRADVPLPGAGVATGFVFSADGATLAFQFSSATVPGDVFAVDTTSLELRRLTTSPSSIDPATLVPPVLERVASFDGESIPLFLYLPREPLRTPPPVVVVIHGGPEGQSLPGFNAVVQYLVARGYAVALPNVRGSVGYGKRFHHLDDVRRRLDSVRDLAALHDWFRLRGDIDPDRAAVFGGSYGGYMVLAALAFQPERWAAGVDIVGISSLVTFLENTSPWRRTFREREYGSLEHDREFLEEVSPLTSVDAIRAPLFIIHGANDPRVPLSEAEQLHATLQAKGVPTELLVYADEGHGLAKLKNRLDAYPRAADFLDRILA